MGTKDGIKFFYLARLEIAGKVWKKEDELKQLKSELAALDRKIQLELAPPVSETAEKKTKLIAEGIRNVPQQSTEETPQLCGLRSFTSPSGNFITNHIIIGHPELYAKNENRAKGIKM